MNASDKIDQLAASLYAVQRELRNPGTTDTATVKTKQGGTYSYSYLSLPALIEHIRVKLEAVSLAVIQDVGGDASGITVRTVITHSSGQWLEVGPLFMPAPADPQQRGSAITYARRYALAAVFNLAADADDDASSATSSLSQQGSADGGTSGQDGEAEAAGAPAPPIAGAPAAPTDAQRWMEEYHPGKPHKMRISPEVPTLEWCAQDTIGKAPCPYSRPVKVPA